MGENSTIEWTDASWTPLKARNPKDGKTGWHCVKISPACAACYAATFNMRRLPNGGTGLDYVATSDAETYLDEKTLRQPLGWRKPKKIFVCSMTDLFGDWVTDGMIDQVFAVMARCPRHTFQVLTKRADRMEAYMNAVGRQGRVNDASIICENHPIWFSVDDGHIHGPEWPLPNVWLGVSVENQRYADERIPRLLNTPAAVRFLSCEPLLGTVDLLRVVWPGLAKPSNPREPHRVDVLRGGYWEDADVFYKGFVNHSDMPGTISWVIAGGESGHGSRPMHPDWLRSLRNQCQAARVPYFFKQFGEFVPVDGREMDHRRPGVYVEPDGKWRDAHIALPSPEAALMRRVGKKAAGRLLDGREWNEFPKVEAAR